MQISGNTKTKNLTVAYFAVLFVSAFFLNSHLYAQQHFFWDNPKTISGDAASFPQTAQGREFGVVLWQEAVKKDNETGQIYISLAVSTGERNYGAGTNTAEIQNDQEQNTVNILDFWKIHKRIAGPYNYALGEPSICNITVDKKDRIIICIASDPSKIEIFISSDKGETFTKTEITNRQTATASVILENNNLPNLLVPKIFCMSDGSYVLWTVRNTGQNLSLFYSHSIDGVTWDPFEQFVTEAALSLNFLPYHISVGNVEYVIYQAFIQGTTNRPSFQLYLKTSRNGGRTWSASKRITNWVEEFALGDTVPDSYSNERVHLSPDIVNDSTDKSVETGNIFMVWERSYGSGFASVYGATINTDGMIVGKLERINSSASACGNPISFNYRNERLVVWFDARRGENETFMAQSSNTNGEWSTWQNSELSKFAQSAFFARPVIVDNNLFLFWQEINDKKNSIILLASDITASTPKLHGVNFTDNKRVSSSIARISWVVPYDSSGISGYSWVWGRNPNAVPPKIAAAGTSVVSAEETATEDGAWYFSIIACDNAGNWSDVEQIAFLRDTTPPPAARIIPLDEDENGFIYSNSFTIAWNQPPASDLEGYAWMLDFLGETNASENAINANYKILYDRFSGEKTPFALRVMGNKQNVPYINKDNGVWCFTVFPIDAVGNVGPASTYIFKTNKYQPHTYITHIEASQDIQGNLKMIIIGRGFSENGDVTNIYFRRKGGNGNARTLSIANNDFTVRTDREIIIPFTENLPAGSYYIFVDHPIRGLASGAEPIDILKSLTVKFGDFTKFWDAGWIQRFRRTFVFNTSTLLLLLLMLFCVFLALLSVRGIGITLTENKSAKIISQALISGGLMPAEKRRLKKVLRRKGLGLRFKLASFTIALVLLVVIMVSVPLYLQMNRTQRETLMKSLWDRSVVLIEGITTSARVFMQAGNVIELGYLPQQSAAVAEARYITITGFGSGVTSTDDFIWASNDNGIRSKINTTSLQIGASRLTDTVSESLKEREELWQNAAQDAVNAMAQSIADYNRESAPLILLDDPISQARLEDIQTTIRSLEDRITRILTDLSSEVISYPEFDIEDSSITGGSAYILYKPILYRQGTSDVYVRGAVRLEISTDTIVKALDEGRRQIFTMIMYIALAALAIGGVGSMIVATLIILPIGRLVKHVEKIRDAEDKSTLEGEDIKIKGKDEIATLGSTINDMTHGLVKAAKAAQDLSIGKEIQKKFIPLEVDSQGNKFTTGFKETKNARFFGYYEGAKGVSGDYFDYRDIDGRYFAIIKCDVAGKGIPASLIMIQVATMFINYFKDWKPSKSGPHIEKIVYQINEFIESLGFKGRFAAFSLCIFDSETGELHFCNAGDNIIHWYDESDHRVKVVTLPETPATGVLPNFLIESSGGYKTQTMQLDHGDILLLYTDGIEEAKRKFRDAAYNDIVCEEGEPETMHDTHMVGQGDEEMGPERVMEIINAVKEKKIYSLYKYHNPAGERKYNFDFTKCTGTVDEVIMGMVSVEKVFRIYSPNSSQNNLMEESRIMVDAKVDAFLQEHFLEYDEFFSSKTEVPNNPAYLYYMNLSEDEQYDDLTILGVHRK
ncbi:MAG: SpoIIE family protein phosphatase [Termitinemataceae bacterium]|nr:MAG: SpoIIE family protein phosphatase [Termitinemataceae bacterium]